MGIVDTAKVALSFITPAGQTNTVEKTEAAPVGSAFNIVEGNINPQSTIQPYNVSTCYNIDGKSSQTQRAGYGYSGPTYVDPRSNDELYLGMNSMRKIQNGGLQEELTKITIPRMIAAANTNRSNLTIRDNYSDIYSSDKGWVLTNSPQGMIACNANTGEYGIIQADGSLVLK